MFHVFRLGYVEFNTRNIEALKNYYNEVMGFTLVEEGPDGSAYFSSSTDHHNIVLNPSSVSAIARFGFQYKSDAGAKEIVKELAKLEIKAELKTDTKPGVSEVVEFTDPDGYQVQLFSEMSLASPGFKHSGIIPNKIGHLSLRVDSAKRSVEFYGKLGFTNTDWIEEFFGFTTCNTDHHVLNFFTSPQKGGMHHLAFELRNYGHLTHSMDYLGKNKIPIIWGPSRHGAGHNIATYHYDPDENMIELFTDADKYVKELDCFEPRPWHRDNPQKPKVWKTDDCISQWGTCFEKALV
ncbi:VOC family protein [Ferviditalea candida]|uniref:VOC family protein n=1 Tax=Ferviditalea candida TaxID=3108399 RepID=A0ABU5ZQ50_9BACL|nr:VOC family protein [Paenibacillaceae bacterium T2]